MMNKEICCGSRVRLSDETRWINGPCNPSDTLGTVTGEDGDGWVGVQWDNGMHNKYLAREEDLIPVDGE